MALQIKNYQGDDDDRRPSCLVEIARLLIRVQMSDMALEITGWIGDDPANPESRCSALLGIASAFAEAGKEQPAAATFDQALNAAHQIEHDSKRAGAMVSVGLALHQAGDGWAAETLAQALAITQRLEDFDRDDKMGDIAKALAKIGDFDNAIKHAHRIQHNWYRSEALQEIAMALVTDGRLSQALALADRTDYATSLGGSDASASEKRDLSLAAIASALVSKNQIDAALVVIDRIQRPHWQARPLAQIGLALANIQDEGATLMFTRALSALDRKGKPTEQARELKEMAKLLVAAGDERASQVFDQSRLLAVQIEDEREYSDALKQVAVALAQLGNFARALEISREIVDAAQQAEALKEIAISLAQAGHFDHALSVAIEIKDGMIQDARVLNGVSRAEALCGVALALKNAGQTKAALEVLDRAFVAATRIDGVSSWSQASILEGIATQFAQAAKCDRASEAVFQIQHESRVPCALAAVAVELAKLGDTRSAKFLDQAWKLAERIADPGERAEALKDMARVLAKAGNKQASQIFERAVESALKANSERRQSYRMQLVGEALAQSGNYDWALEIANQIERGWQKTPVLQALFKSLALAEDQRASSVFKILLEEARLIGTYMGARDHALRDVIVDLIEVNQRQRALEFLEQMSVDSLSSCRTEASNLIAKSFAQSGEFDEALAMLDLSSVSELRDRVSAFIHHLASWASAFEKIHRGLSLEILSEITRIGGWTSPAWLRIHEILTRTATPKAPTSFSQHDEALDTDHLDAFAVHQQKMGKSDAARQSAQERELQGVMEILGRQAITDRAPGHRAEKHLAIPRPHPAADPDKAARLNLEYQQSLAEWKALPWRKRLWTRKPEPP